MFISPLTPVETYPFITLGLVVANVEIWSYDIYEYSKIAIMEANELNDEAATQADANYLAQRVTNQARNERGQGNYLNDEAKARGKANGITECEELAKMRAEKNALKNQEIQKGKKNCDHGVVKQLEQTLQDIKMAEKAAGCGHSNK